MSGLIRASRAAPHQAPGAGRQADAWKVELLSLICTIALLLFGGLKGLAGETLDFGRMGFPDPAHRQLLRR
jgi:hypothetical protein